MSANHAHHSGDHEAQDDKGHAAANLRLAWIIGGVALLLYVAGFFIQR